MVTVPSLQPETSRVPAEFRLMVFTCVKEHRGDDRNAKHFHCLRGFYHSLKTCLTFTNETDLFLIQKLMPQDLVSPQNHVPTQPGAQTGISCGWRSWQKGTARPVEQRKLTCMKAFWPSISIKIFSHLDSGVPGRRVQPLVKPTHLTDGVIVAHQGVLPPAIRDGVEITEGTQSWMLAWAQKSQSEDQMSTFYTYMLLSHEEHTTVLPSASIRHDESAWKSQREKVRSKEKCVNQYKYICVPCWRMRRSSGTPSALWKTF